MILGIKVLNHSAEMATSDGPPGPPEVSAAPAASPALGFWTLAPTLAGALALALGLFVAPPHALSSLLGRWRGLDETSIWFHLTDGGFKFVLFIAYVRGIGLIPEIGRVYAYHGAEHQAIFAFEAGDSPLTPALAARHLTLRPRRGPAFIFLELARRVLIFRGGLPAVFPGRRRIFPGAGLGRRGPENNLDAAFWPGWPMRSPAWPAAGSPPVPAGAGCRACPLRRLTTTRRPDADQLEAALTALRRAVEGLRPDALGRHHARNHV